MWVFLCVSVSVRVCDTIRDHVGFVCVFHCVKGAFARSLVRFSWIMSVCCAI